jgi:hypothetical protein
LLQKLIMGGAALAVAAAALLLVSIPGATFDGGTAEATVRGLSASSTTINRSGTSVLTIDSDTGTNVQVLSTVGTVTITTCNGLVFPAGVCVAANVIGETTANMTVCGTALGGVCAALADAGTDTLIVTYTAPATGPATATLTVIQGTSAKSLNIKVRGAASTVELSVLRAASTSTSTCVGSTSNVIRSSTATGGNTTGFLCGLVKDSTGNRTPAAAVIYSTTAGTLTASSDVTGAAGQRANAVTIAAGSTGTSGKTATISISSSGKTGTASIKFGGNASTCTIAADPATVTVGGSSAITISVLDSASGPIPDAVVVTVIQINSGGGANAAILNAGPTTNNGTATTSLIAALPGAIAIGATIGTRTCTGTVVAAAAAAATPATPAAGTPAVSGFAPGAGASGLTVFNDLTSTADAWGLVCGSNDSGSSISMTNASGNTYALVNGAPSFANNGFNTNITLSGTQAAFVSCA